MRATFLLILMAMSIVSCNDDSDLGPNFTDTNPDDVELRVRNSSSFSLSDIKIHNRSLSRNFENLSFSATSEYRNFSKADSYFGVEFTAANKYFLYIPSETDDYLKGGNYKISIYSVDTSKLTFTFKLEGED